MRLKNGQLLISTLDMSSIPVQLVKQRRHVRTLSRQWASEEPPATLVDIRAKLHTAHATWDIQEAYSENCAMIYVSGRRPMFLLPQSHL